MESRIKNQEESRVKEEEINREINAMANKIQKTQIYSNKKHENSKNIENKR